MSAGDTTESIITAALGADCYACGQSAQCFDPDASGTTCEMLSGDATLLPSLPGGPSCPSVFGASSSPVTEATVCLGTLKAILASRCAQDGLLDPCFCGSVSTDACQSGAVPPDGPVVPEYDCDFDTTDSPTIENDLLTWGNFGAASATNIVQCLAFAADCPTPCPLHAFGP